MEAVVWFWWMMGGNVGWELLCKRMPARQANKTTIPGTMAGGDFAKVLQTHRQQWGMKMLIVVTLFYAIIMHSEAEVALAGLSGTSVVIATVVYVLLLFLVPL
jgi:hypothetical protein